MSYEIIPMTAAHVPAVAALEESCFADPWSLRSIAGELENPLARWLVAVDGDAVLGYVGSQTVLDEADVMNVAVAPEARRQGVGKALMTALLDVLREHDVKTLTLEVRASNDPALALYDGLGFVPVGRRPRYYRHPTEDAVILRVVIGAASPRQQK